MKKHRLSTVLAAALVGVSAAAFPTAAELSAPEPIVAEAANPDFEFFGLEFSYRVGYGLVLERYTGSDTSVSIGSWYGGTPWGPLPVIEIKANAFANKHITSVSIPYTVTKIGRRAFYNTDLTTVDLASNGTFELTIGEEAFGHCTSLQNVLLDPGCIAADRNQKSPFNQCSNLWKINGDDALKFVSGKRVVNSNSAIRNIIKKFFYNGEGIKFVDFYCSEVCDYAVLNATGYTRAAQNANGTWVQVGDWISEAARARLLYDWLLQHCKPEDGTNGESWFDANNSFYTTAFLSYGLNERGYEIGEATSGGFAKAYAMLLQAADMKSYVVCADTLQGGYRCYWNVIKADNRFYQCDPISDLDYRESHGLPASYRFFMQYGDAMDALHEYEFGNTMLDGSDRNKHEYLSYTTSAGNSALNQCNYYFSDVNGDGLLDNDYNFDGSRNDYDTYFKAQITPFFNNGYTPSNGGLSALLNYLVAAPLTPSELLWLAQNGYHIQ